jgi:hypothetical protein
VILTPRYQQTFITGMKEEGSVFPTMSPCTENKNFFSLKEPKR